MISTGERSSRNRLNRRKNAPVLLYSDPDMSELLPILYTDDLALKVEENR